MKVLVLAIYSLTSDPSKMANSAIVMRLRGGDHLRFGRLDPCEVVVPNSSVSKLHCYLEVEGDTERDGARHKCFAKDVSSNGTWIYRPGERDEDASASHALTTNRLSKLPAVKLERDKKVELAVGDTLFLLAPQHKDSWRCCFTLDTADTEGAAGGGGDLTLRQCLPGEQEVSSEGGKKEMRDSGSAPKELEGTTTQKIITTTTTNNTTTASTTTTTTTITTTATSDSLLETSLSSVGGGAGAGLKRVRASMSMEDTTAAKRARPEVAVHAGTTVRVTSQGEGGGGVCGGVERVREACVCGVGDGEECDDCLGTREKVCSVSLCAQLLHKCQSH